MQTKIKLHSTDGKVIRQGTIDVEQIADCALVKYQGTIYVYRTSSEVMTANFHEASEPMVIDSLIKDRQP